LAGGQPSVLRAALMFTCIVIAENFGRKNNIYNTLAASAFILLCINPYWLWDVGFQLSYAAVLSIVIFFRPIYNWFCFKNKIVDFLWKLNAVTFAAQILTLPISIFHFHQFPVYFFLTNFIAVPLSSIILFGEIFLCAISFIPAIALFTGKVLTWLLWSMNTYIEYVEAIPFSLWDGLQLDIYQTVLLILFITGTSYWLIEKRMNGLKTGIIAFLAFVVLRSYSFIQAENQEKIIVYNVPQKSAVDFIDGRNYYFLGDSTLLEDDFARNFHLKPSRILNRISPVSFLPGFSAGKNYITYHSKHIAFIDKAVSFSSSSNKATLDLLVLSGNPKIYMNKLAGALIIKQVVIDGSVPAWKANYWKKDCNSLGIPCHDVNISGAFVMNL
jgi:competence protein ComEC